VDGCAGPAETSVGYDKALRVLPARHMPVAVEHGPGSMSPAPPRGATAGGVRRQGPAGRPLEAVKRRHHAVPSIKSGPSARAHGGLAACVTA